VGPETNGTLQRCTLHAAALTRVGSVSCKLRLAMSVRRVLPVSCSLLHPLARLVARNRRRRGGAAGRSRGLGRRWQGASPGGGICRLQQALRGLQQELAAAFDNPSVSALWAGAGAVVRQRGKCSSSAMAHTLVMPASNMKLVTMSVAAARLGWDFRFATQIATNGATREWHARGRSHRHWQWRSDDQRVAAAIRRACFQSWADQLRGAGHHADRGTHRWR